MSESEKPRRQCPAPLLSSSLLSTPLPVRLAGSVRYAAPLSSPPARLRWRRIPLLPSGEVGKIATPSGARTNTKKRNEKWQSRDFPARVGPWVTEPVEKGGVSGSDTNCCRRK